MKLAPQPSPTAVAATIASLVLAAVLASGCGSEDSTSPTQSEPSTATESTERSSSAKAQTDEGEPVVPTPRGAAAVSCSNRQSDIDGLRVTGIDCGSGEAIAGGWSAKSACATPATGSRFACSVRGFRCLGASTSRGVAVSCSRKGSSIAFVARRG